MASKLVRSLERVAGRLFRAPFENLPLEYGDPVPPELREFEAEAEASQREITEVQTPKVHGQRSQPARRDDSLSASEDTRAPVLSAEAERDGHT